MPDLAVAGEAGIRPYIYVERVDDTLWAFRSPCGVSLRRTGRAIVLEEGPRGAAVSWRSPSATTVLGRPGGCTVPARVRDSAVTPGVNAMRRRVRDLRSGPAREGKQ